MPEGWATIGHLPHGTWGRAMIDWKKIRHSVETAALLSGMAAATLDSVDDDLADDYGRRVRENAFDAHRSGDLPELDRNDSKARQPGGRSRRGRSSQRRL
jgi:hypothetical protein